MPTCRKQLCQELAFQLQTGYYLLKPAAVCLVEGREIGAIDVEHGLDLMLTVEHGHDNL